MVQLKIGDTIYLPGIIDALIITEIEPEYYSFSTGNPGSSVIRASKSYVDKYETPTCQLPSCTISGGKRKSRKNRRKSHRRRK